MKQQTLVTGASGHLGRNLVKKLSGSGSYQVKAGIRNPEKAGLFKGLDCEVLYTELSDQNSLNQAMKGVKLLFHTAAVYRQWARDPETDILIPNIEGTRRVLEAAHHGGVERVVHVSSITALGHGDRRITEKSWNKKPANAYARSKVESEILALELSENLGIPLVSVLPAAIVGPDSRGHLTPTMQILFEVLKGKRPVDPCFNLHFVDVEDVVNGMIVAAQKGRDKERYILGCEDPVSTTQIFETAKSLNPSLRSPVKLQRWSLMVLGACMEIRAKLSGKEPSITRSLVKSYYKDQHILDISKSRAHLGFSPRDPVTAIKKAMDWLLKQPVFFS